MKTNEIEEAERTIAYFMGLEVETRDGYEGWVRNKCFLQYPYSRSLDCLVSVWGKLDCVAVFDKLPPMYACELRSKNSMGEVIGLDCAESIQQAACLATAKAIKWLRVK